ncbi:hypothetical protein [Methylomarinum vadi]|uniref:hypothetical protein n=1 Tax=Methylomarinum vadi TaxID=438855 RepID=UPI0012678D2A|nr:hypothetical protein [Methylomarinum vadi]
MKRQLTLGILLLSGISTNTLAQCPGAGWSQITTVPGLQGTLIGNTVCVSDGNNGWDAQEYHAGSPTDVTGSLIDYKHGPNNSSNPDPLKAIDPTSPVGSWTINDNTPNAATVTYSYGSLSYENEVWQNGSQYCFDNGTDAVVATIEGGSDACGQ